MNKLYTSLESMYSRVAKRNNQLEMLCITNSVDPETEELLFPELQNKKLAFPELQNTHGHEYVNVTGIQVPDNLEDILRPKFPNC